MKDLRNILLILLPIFLGSCRTVAPQYDYQELARASVRLGIDIDMKDNHALYIESANWLGVPYRNGGTTRRGVDCSGLTSAIYDKVYHKNLERNSDDQRKKDCRKVKKGKLREGDLVFFHNGRKKKRATHVGIYLKDQKFIHASTSQGVIISTLNEEYWRKHWLSGGRP
jgi:lipoprotein Spr